MAQLKKYLPIMLALVGIATLLLNYDQWRMMKSKECNCDDPDSSGDLGPIT